MNNDINLNLIYNLLFTSPEDGSMLYVDNINKDENGNVVFTVVSLDKKQCWKHTITTEEV